MKKRILSGTCCVLIALSLAACQPKYVSPLESPVVGMDEDAPYMMDFVQIHNAIVEMYAEDSRFPYIKNVVIDGTNDPYQISLTIDAVEGATQEAIDFFIATLLLNISNEACIQDSRYTAPSAEGFGSFYDRYALKVYVTEGETVITDVVYEAGEGLPYDQSVSPFDDTDTE